MIEFGITHLKPNGNYVPHSVRLKILHFACRGYLCVLYDWHSLHFSWKALCEIVYSTRTVTASVPFCVQWNTNISAHACYQKALYC